MKYLDAKTFSDFCVNQNKLIEVLNHRTDTIQGSLNKIEKEVITLGTDIGWLKKILWAILSVTSIATIGNLIANLKF